MSAAPLYRDPILDGAADPALIYNRGDNEWWMMYTARRAFGPDLPGAEWIHGTAVGIASSGDQGETWLYRGTADGLDTEWGTHTYWAPEVIDDGENYHMFVSVVRGVPTTWTGHERHIRHYTSTDLSRWTYRSTLDLSSNYVIDACVVRRPDGGWRMWYKDEADGNHTWSADSEDLFSWSVLGPAVTHAPHEGPNVFRLGSAWWMVVDEWQGQRVLRSTDLLRWDPQDLILDQPGRRTDDGTVGLHADVVVITETTASIFYFTHPDRFGRADPGSYSARRTSVQVARLHLVGDRLACDRNEEIIGPVLP